MIMDAGGHTNLSCPIEARSYEFRSTENEADGRTGKSSSLGPGTPGCGRENRGFVTDAESLLTISSPNEIQVDPCRDDASSANAADSPHTPRDGVFDPFAPRPCGLGFAPCEKFLAELHTGVARRLNLVSSLRSVEKFPNVEGVTSESVYGDQALEVPAPALPNKFPCEGFETPPSCTLLNGGSVICPGAPVKPASKRRNIDLKLRRRLEF